MAGIDWSLKKSPAKAIHVHKTEEIVEETDNEITQTKIATSLVQDTSIVAYASDGASTLISDVQQTIRKSKFMRFTRFAEDTASSENFESTPDRSLPEDQHHETSTPYSEMKLISVEETPRTIPRMMKEGLSQNDESDGDSYKLFSYLNCDLPDSLDIDHDHALSADYLIPPNFMTEGTPLTLVLDLDETLIYNRLLNGRMLRVPILRPFLIPFLLSIPHHQVEVVVWTASTSATARHVVSYILYQVKNLVSALQATTRAQSSQVSQQENTRLIDHVIARNSLWFLSPENEMVSSDIPRVTVSYHTKDLRHLGRDLGGVILVENSYHCPKLQPQNSVIVKDFHAMNADYRLHSGFLDPKEPTMESLLDEYYCFQSLLEHFSDPNRQNEPDQSICSRCKTSLSEHQKDMTLVSLALLVRETVRRRSDASKRPRVTDILQQMADENFPIHSAQTKSQPNGTQSFLMNFLGIPAPQSPSHFASLNSRINAPIHGSYYELPRELFGEAPGRNTV